MAKIIGQKSNPINGPKPCIPWLFPKSMIQIIPHRIPTLNKSTLRMIDAFNNKNPQTRNSFTTQLQMAKLQYTRIIAQRFKNNID